MEFVQGAYVVSPALFRCLHWARSLKLQRDRVFRGIFLWALWVGMAAEGDQKRSGAM